MATETYETFESTIKLLAAMASEGSLFIALSPPYSVSLDLERTALRKHLAAGNLTEESVRDTAAAVGGMIRALLDNDVESYVRVRSEDSSSAEAESSDSLQAKFKCIDDHLINDHLRNRYDIKRSSKAPSFASIDWDIKVKLADAKLEALKPFPYATARLTYQTEYSADLPFYFFQRAFESVQVNFTVDELTYLSRVLEEIKHQLMQEEAKHGTG